MLPRRFEPGCVHVIIEREIALANLGPMKKSYRGGARRPFILGGKRYSQLELIELINQLRINRGLEPITLPSASAPKEK